MSDQLLSPGQAAAQLGIGAHGVRHLIRQGRLPAIRVGRHYVISAAVLKKFCRPPRGRPKTNTG